MSCFDTAWMVRGHPVGVGSYTYSEADVILPVETIKALSDREIIAVIRVSVEKAETLREEEDVEKAVREELKNRPRPTEIRIPKSGYIYLVQDHAGYFKIGQSKRVNNRVFDMSMRMPFGLRLIAQGLFENPQKKEAELHRRFESKRLGGEWFALEPGDVSEVASILQEAGIPEAH